MCMPQYVSYRKVFSYILYTTIEKHLIILEPTKPPSKQPSPWWPYERQNHRSGTTKIHNNQTNCHHFLLSWLIVKYFKFLILFVRHECSFHHRRNQNTTTTMMTIWAPKTHTRNCKYTAIKQNYYSSYCVMIDCRVSWICLPQMFIETPSWFNLAT